MSGIVSLLTSVAGLIEVKLQVVEEESREKLKIIPIYSIVEEGINRHTMSVYGEALGGTRVGLYLFIRIIWGIIWGFATHKVIENKGYYENWFWWGFFFGFIAFIVACTKPDKRSVYIEDTKLSQYSKECYEKEIIQESG